MHSILLFIRVESFKSFLKMFEYFFETFPEFLIKQFVGHYLIKAFDRLVLYFHNKIYINYYNKFDF